jgi:penicillin-binding protein 1A
VIVLGGADDERFNPPSAGGDRKKPSERFADGDVVKVIAFPATLGNLPPKAKHGDRVVSFAPGAEGAVVVIDPRTREVLAMIGGYRKVAGGLNRAMAAKRQPGSAFKPIVYAAALASGRFTPASIVNDSPEVYDLWKPENSHKGTFEGPVRLRSGARQVDQHRRDQGDARRRARRRGGARGPARHRQQAAAHAVARARLGRGDAARADQRLRDVRRWRPVRAAAVRDRAPGGAAGGGQPRGDVAGRRVHITDMMRSVVEQGTATKAKSLGVTIAGKTGTSNDARDTWFVGMTPNVVIGVWVGNDDNSPMGRGEVGGVTALPAFIETLKAMAPRNQSFLRPPGVVTADIDLATGLLAAPGAPAKTHMTEVFVDGTAPTEVAPLPGEVDAQTFVTDEYGDEAEAPPP